MKRFSEYLKEDFDPSIFNADGGISIDDPTVVDAINSNLERSTSCSYRTPYNALEEVRKVLAYYKIFLPKSVFLDQNHGNDVFEISQFGEKTGMNNQGEVVTANDSPLFVYFEWSLNEKGMYDIFASIVNQDDLDEILSDYENEVEDDETDLHEEASAAERSKMLYKIVNAKKAEEHNKEAQSFKTEEVMPNLKKKFSNIQAQNKVTLAKRMQTESEETPESKRNLKRIRLFTKAAEKSKEEMNKGNLEGAKKKASMMKRLRKKLSEPDKLDEVSKEWLEKKASRGFDLHHAYIWKEKYKKADKKIKQIKKIGEYMQKKGMNKPAEPSKEEPDELQKRYNELQYKGD